MNLTIHSLSTESDFFRARNFLREVFLANERLEHSWTVARLDYWRWHFIATCQFTRPFDQVMVGWQTATGELAAVMHAFGFGEIRAHIHPRYRSAALEDEMFSYAEQHYSTTPMRLKTGSESSSRYSPMTLCGSRSSPRADSANTLAGITITGAI
ncbi:hypothetical protein ADN00_09655 [Ornatilinea apprima]|uniref:N-acetyltransferase domain-containing protein n=1 Tax=Ornatilinea apprima TaxID=1134406 RepID=A0A0P6X9D4_9CHLR|nr:hypothetical protein [Ornatilinea apprima]KPL76859.1 hypothetical protein ADN00_09655 [Ornatilinea apprima]